MFIRTRIVGITKDRRTKDLLSRGRAVEEAIRDFYANLEWHERVKADLLRRFPSPIYAIREESPEISILRAKVKRGFANAYRSILLSTQAE